MSGTMQCPSCKEQIDDDSRYCDMCGEQIFVCSICGRPGKGKRCIFDGKEMIPATGAATGAGAGAAMGAGKQAVQPAQINKPAAQTAASSQSEKLTLSSASAGINLEVSDGDIIGRKNGPFAGILGGFPHISGTHCKFFKTGETWYVKDMGSTNGTFYNNARIEPDNQAPLQNGAKIKIADLELLIAFNTASGTVRV